MWYVYILKCENNTLYTGVTTDLNRRFTEHKISKGAKYTKANKPEEILYSEQFKNRSDACKRETQIKSWKREKKLELIKGG